MLKEEVYYGYHGTTKACAENILEENIFVPSNNNKWLGEGIYFFIDVLSSSGKLEAIKYMKRKKKEKSNNIKVIKALIISKKIFNLTDNSDEIHGIFNKVYNKAKEKYYKSKGTYKGFSEHLIYTLISDVLKSDAILVLVDGAKKNPDFRYTIRRPQLILCIKNSECIEEMSLCED